MIVSTNIIGEAPKNVNFLWSLSFIFQPLFVAALFDFKQVMCPLWTDNLINKPIIIWLIYDCKHRVMQNESKGTQMGKDIFPTPMVVKIFLPSSTSDYILTKIAWLMAKASQVYRVFKALFCSMACFVIHLCCHGRDLPAASSGTLCFLSGILEVPSRIWWSVREGVRLFPSRDPGCRRKDPQLAAHRILSQ